MMLRSPMLALAAFALLTALGCGGPSEYALAGSPRAAGADGLIQVESIEGGNRLVTISVDHLPPPARLGEGLTTYVVWFVPHPEGRPVKAGRLEYDTESRQGRMHATTPLTRFELQITAEESGDTAGPSDVVVADRRIGDEE